MTTEGIRKKCIVTTWGRVYGPYKRKDGRLHVVTISNEGEQRSISYPKFLMERILGRKLDPQETVDHIDGDFTNDDLSNLRVLSRSVHASNDQTRRAMPLVGCRNCGTQFVAKRTHNHDGFGYFCKRICRKQYKSAAKLGLVDSSPSPRLPAEYHTRHFHKTNRYGKPLESHDSHFP